MAMSAAMIKQIQAIVGVKVDGIWGPQTAAAVKRWQSAHGLTPDGIVGPQTSAKMGLGTGGGGSSSGGGGGHAGSGGGGSSAAQKLAEDYGYQLAFLQSDPELYAVFKRAMDGGWDQTRFVAAVKNTHWYKTHGEAYRTNSAQKYTDPATYNQNLASTMAQIGDKARAMGANLTPAQLRSAAEHATLGGWNDSQIQNYLASYVKYNNNLGGQAGVNMTQLQQTAWRNGLTISQHSLNTWVQAMARGDKTVEDYQKYLRQSAKTLAPGFSKELDAGMDLYDLASPYMQTMAQTLELNPSDIDLFDPTIRKALGSSSDKDGQPGSTPLWQFEQALRQDKRYMKTQQAQDKVMSVGHQVLRDFGLLGA